MKSRFYNCVEARLRAYICMLSRSSIKDLDALALQQRRVEFECADFLLFHRNNSASRASHNTTRDRKGTRGIQCEKRA
jgi:hypothetical protein